MTDVYCLDTSAWTGIRRGYPYSVFPSLWGKIDTLIKGDRLISPREVYVELEKQDDEVFRWVKQRKRLFRELNEEQLAVASDIMKQFPGLIDSLKATPEADPFVIALAIVETKNMSLLGGQCTVVSEEKPSNNEAKPKIPNVCSACSVTHLRILDVCNNEGWIF